MEEMKSVSASHLGFVARPNSARSYRDSPCSQAGVERSRGRCCSCVGTAATRAEDSGWEVEPLRPLFLSAHLPRQGGRRRERDGEESIAQQQHA